MENKYCPVGMSIQVIRGPKLFANGRTTYLFQHIFGCDECKTLSEAYDMQELTMEDIKATLDSHFGK